MQTELNIAHRALSFKINLKTFFTHLLICVLIFIMPNEIFLLPVLLAFLYYFYSKSNVTGVLLVGIYALCCKSDVVYFGYALVFGVLYFLDRRKIVRDQQINSINKRFSRLLIYLVVIYVLFLFDEGSIFSFPLFAITFLSPVLIMKYIFTKEIQQRQLRSFLTNLLYICIVQSLIALFLQAIPYGITLILAVTTLGDTMFGTTNTANSLAYLIFTGIMPFLISVFSYGKLRITRSAILICLVLILFVGILYLNDAKTEIDAFVLAGIFIYLAKKLFGEGNFAIKILKFIGIILLLILFQSLILSKFLSVTKDYDDYINGENNAKIEYYQKTFDPDTRSWFEYAFGTGGGSNGSRVGNALASDVLYKDKNGLKLPESIPPHSNRFTRHYLAKLYTADYAKTVKDRSALLGNPFNSICAVFVEFGVIGTILLMLFYLKIFSSLIGRSDMLSITALILLVANVIIGFVDQAFERPMMMHLMFLFIGLALRIVPVVNPGRPDTENNKTIVPSLEVQNL